MVIDVKKLDKAMASKMFTLKELSKESGVSNVTIIRLKNGTQKPKPITVGKIAKALGVDVTEIIETEK